MIEIIDQNDQNQYQIDWQTISVQGSASQQRIPYHAYACWCGGSAPRLGSSDDENVYSRIQVHRRSTSNQSSIINHIRIEYHQNSCRWRRAPQVWIANTAILSKNISDASDSIVRFILCLYSYPTSDTKNVVARSV